MKYRTMAEVYSILDGYETEGCDLYNYGAISAIGNYFKSRRPQTKWVCDISEWPNEEGGVCAVSFIDSGHPQLILFDYKY